MRGMQGSRAHVGINKEVISLMWEGCGGKEEKENTEHDLKTKKTGRKIEVNSHKHHQTPRHAHVCKKRVEWGSACKLQRTPPFILDLYRFSQTCSQTEELCMVLRSDSGPKASMTALLRFWFTSACVFRQNVAAS